jgi:multiple sugar transport system substrate-binding protein
VSFKDRSGNPTTVAGGTSFVIPAAAKNPGAACAWMTALVSDASWSAAGAARADKLAKTPGAINAGLFTGSPSADKPSSGQARVRSGGDSLGPCRAIRAVTGSSQTTA